MRNLDESITSHILYSLVGLVRKLKQFVDYSLKKLPVRLEETRVLADNVHNIGRTATDRGQSVKAKSAKTERNLHYCLVVLASLHFGQTQQIFDDGHQESLFRLLVHRP